MRRLFQGWGKGKCLLMSVMKIDLHINHEDVPTERYSEVRDPGRLTDVVGQVAIGTVQHVEQAVNAAHQAFLSWRKSALEERLDVLSRIAKLLEDESQSLAETLSRENGVLLSTSLGEMNMAIHAVHATIKNAESFFNPKQAEDETSWVSVEKRPIGVIAGIVPWNAPMVLTIQKKSHRQS